MIRKALAALPILAVIMVAAFWASTYANSLFGRDTFYLGPPGMGVEWANGMWLAEFTDEDSPDGFRASALEGHCVTGHIRDREPLNLGRPFQFDLGPFAVRREYLDPNDTWMFRERVRLTLEQAQALPTVTATHIVEFDLWLVFVLVAAYPAVRLIWRPIRRGRRRQRGLCIHCGYNLNGNTSGVCPECSEKFEPGNDRCEEDA